MLGATTTVLALRSFTALATSLQCTLAYDNDVIMIK